MSLIVVSILIFLVELKNVLSSIFCCVLRIDSHQYISRKHVTRYLYDTEKIKACLIQYIYKISSQSVSLSNISGILNSTQLYADFLNRVLGYIGKSLWNNPSQDIRCLQTPAQFNNLVINCKRLLLYAY